MSCGARTAKTLPLGKSLPPQVMDMFNSNLGSLGKLNKRTLFQSRQFDKTTKLMMKMESEKMTRMREEAGPEVIRDLDKELERLQRQLREAGAERERMDVRLSHKSGSQQLSGGPLTSHNLILGRRSLAQSGASPGVGGEAQSGGAARKGNFTFNRLF